jgi:hypothetical protein
MVLTVSFALLSATGRSSPVTRNLRHANKPSLSVGRPGPHDFAVRLSAARPDERSLRIAKASIASRPTCRDDRDAPLFIKAGCPTKTHFLENGS